MREHKQVFLVVIDESPELRPALRYACRRALHTDGQVAMLHVVEPEAPPVWAGIGRLIEQEAHDASTQLLARHAALVEELTGRAPLTFARRGERREELLKLLHAEPSISVLVLGAAVGGKGPGPLISALTGTAIDRLRVPVTIVPGNLTDQEIDAIA
ncbi:MAG TPA: universal stress protein [Dongiaceae bacterium]|jgi:nucleotide-binding universal stress UspA family protein|nr:universal stress protein [Dongiaceae bacterium]